MFKNLLKLALLVYAGTQNLWAQSNTDVEMADLLRSSGKIYVLVAVILIILFGMVGMLLYLEKRLSRLEKQQ